MNLWEWNGNAHAQKCFMACQLVYQLVYQLAPQLAPQLVLVQLQYHPVTSNMDMIQCNIDKRH